MATKPTKKEPIVIYSLYRTLTKIRPIKELSLLYNLTYLGVDAWFLQSGSRSEAAAATAEAKLKLPDDDDDFEAVRAV
jgi:hypothetical protein